MGDRILARNRVVSPEPQPHAAVMASCMSSRAMHPAVRTPHRAPRRKLRAHLLLLVEDHRSLHRRAPSPRRRGRQRAAPPLHPSPGALAAEALTKALGPDGRLCRAILDGCRVGHPAEIVTPAAAATAAATPSRLLAARDLTQGARHLRGERSLEPPSKGLTQGLHMQRSHAKLGRVASAYHDACCGRKQAEARLASGEASATRSHAHASSTY